MVSVAMAVSAAVACCLCQLATSAPCLRYIQEADTNSEIEEPQCEWTGATMTILAAYARRGEYVQAAAETAGEMYGYGKFNVFLNSKATKEIGEARSCFVGAEEVKGGYPEDDCFAIKRGKGWKDVVFKNHQIQLNGDAAFAMGSNNFARATTGDFITVEYTFGYKQNDVRLSSRFRRGSARRG